MGLDRRGAVPLQLARAAKRRGDPLDLELTGGDLPSRLASFSGIGELAFVARRHAGEDRSWAPLRLGVVAAETDEPARAVVSGRQRAVKPDTPVQCFGPRAHRFDSHLVEHERVRLVFGVERRDVYGRLLAYVYLGDRFVNAELVRRGFARTLTIAPNDKFAGRLKRLEIAAARAGRGLWSACEP